MSEAYLLVSHGSRDPRPEIAMQRLAEYLVHKVTSGGTSPPQSNLVGTAYLELSPEPLHRQINQFAFDVAQKGCDRLKIFPLFLLSGVHVTEDIPAEVELAKQAISQNISIEVQPYLGSHRGLESLLAARMAGMTGEKIILAHGSRLDDANTAIEAMAGRLGAVAAFWAMSPDLDFRVKELVTLGNSTISIIPYFLFAGGITDAIADAVTTLQLQFPKVNFDVAEPLGASADLANLIWDTMEK